MCCCVCMPVLVIVLIENCNLLMFEWKNSIWKGLMYVEVAVGNIERKSRFTGAEGQSRNFTVAEGETMVSNKKKFIR